MFRLFLVFALSANVVAQDFDVAISQTEIRDNRIAEAQQIANAKEADARDYRTAIAWLEPLDQKDPEVSALVESWTARYCFELSKLVTQKFEDRCYNEAIELAAELCRPSLDPSNQVARQLLEKKLAPNQLLRPQQLRRVEWVREVIAMNYEDDAAYLYRLHGGYGDAGDQRFGEVSRTPVPEHPNVIAIRDKMDSISIPKVSFDDTPLSEVIQFLNEQSDIKIDLEIESRGDELEAESDLFGGDLGFGGLDLGNISFKFEDITLLEALRHTAELARFKYRIDPSSGEVAVVAQWEFAEPLFEGIFRIPPNWGQGEPNFDLIGELYKEGFMTPTDGWLKLDGRLNLLRARTSEANLNSIQWRLKFEAHDLDYAKAERDPASMMARPELFGLEKRSAIKFEKDNSDPAQQANNYVSAKLHAIHLDRFEFDSLTLTQAVEALKSSSIELDELEADVSRKGVNIIIRVGQSRSGDFGEAGAAAEDLNDVDHGPKLRGQTLENVSLRKAIEAVASAAQLKMKVEPHAVVIIPLHEESEDKFTAVFDVPPNFTRIQLSTEAKAKFEEEFPDREQRKKGNQKVIEDSALTFLKGASAIYNASNNQLIVRNTKSNLIKVEAWLELFREEAGAWYRSPILGPWELKKDKYENDGESN